MWLLNTKTYKLQNFASAEVVPEYTILSHCWRDGEVSFADIQDLELARTRPGWPKIRNTCRYVKKVLREHYLWVWIDTCCIDKTSSAELSEAINSMFAWYRDAAVCIVYLDDVPAGTDPGAAQSAFRESRWFTRGWTLQELVAPEHDIFFLCEHWTFLGTRDALALVLKDVTGMWMSILRNRRRGRDHIAELLDLVSVAEWMSWAAGRQTTRPEDRAYSLMGIFDVVIPIMYGEGGANAFRRLQLEILRRSNDQSLFAWGKRLMKPLPWRRKRTMAPWQKTNPYPEPGQKGFVSQYAEALLAVSPSDFAEASGVWPSSSRLPFLTDDLGIPPIREPHYFDTDYGIRMRLPLRALGSRYAEWPLYCAALACQTSGDPPYWTSLILARVGSSDVYFCVSLDTTNSPEEVPMDRVRLVSLPLLYSSPSRFRRLLGWTRNSWKSSTIYILTERPKHLPERFKSAAYLHMLVEPTTADSCGGDPTTHNP